MKHAAEHKRTDFRKYESLSVENRENAVQMVDAVLTENGVDNAQRARHARLLKTVLQKYSEIDEEAPFRINAFRKYKMVVISLHVKSAAYDPTAEGEEVFSGNLLCGMADPPKWRYLLGQNILYYTSKTVVPGRKALKYVIHYMDKEKKAFRTGVALRFVNMCILVLEPFLAARIITALTDSELKKLLMLAVLMALLEASSCLVTYISSRNLTKAYTTMRDEMQTDLAKNVLEIKTEHIDSHSSGVFIQRIMEETGNVVDGLDKMLYVVTEAFRLVALLIAFALISVQMMLFEILLFLIYFLIVRSQAKKLNDDNRRLRRSKESLNGVITELVKASRDIKLLHCEESFSVKAKEVITEYADRTRDVENHSNTYIFARTQFVAWTDLFYIGLLALLMARNGMTAATALVLYNYNGKTFLSARAVSNAAEYTYALLLAAERVYQLLNSMDFEKEEWGKEQLDTVRGEIEMRDVSFSYRHGNEVLSPVLKGVDLKIRPGESVALVGKSGCGKSTILSLITRLYEPDGGEIQLDGRDIAKLDKDSIRGNIGMVSQMPYLFNMSIRDNFAVVKADVTEEEMVEACRTACIHDDIMKFADGYDTVAGEGGVMLSGGQRQRIALARCLIRDYPVIVLDEATSALDNNTQEKIREAIENMRDRTVVMVAHRLSTVINCDRLFFIEDGKILAAGTHSELLESSEAYRKLCGEELRKPLNPVQYAN